VSPLFVIGVVLLIGALFLSRYLSERGMKLLSPEEKLALLDSFSRLRAFGSLPLLVVFLSFFGIRYLPQNWMWPAYYSGWCLVATYFVVMYVMIFRKFKAIGINPNFVASQRRVRWVLYGGFAAFFILNTLAQFVSR
jgi:hypothetical protein